MVFLKVQILDMPMTISSNILDNDNSVIKLISKIILTKVDNNNNIVSQYIRTTVGRIIFNKVIHESLVH